MPDDELNTLLVSEVVVSLVVVPPPPLNALVLAILVAPEHFKRMHSAMAAAHW